MHSLCGCCLKCGERERVGKKKEKKEKENTS